MFLSVAGVPIDQFQGKATEFVDGLQAGAAPGKTIDPYAIYGAQAAAGHARRDRRVATARAADVIAKLFDIERQRTACLGTFKINENGDPARARGRGRRLSRSTRPRTSSRPRRRSRRSQTTVDAALGSRRSTALRTQLGREGIALPPHFALSRPHMASTDGMPRALARHRSVVNGLRLGLVAAIVAVARWSNFVKDPTRVHQHRPDRPHERHDLRRRRARLHARLRHPRS